MCGRSVVRGSHYCIGFVAGEAQLRNAKADFSAVATAVLSADRAIPHSSVEMCDWISQVVGSDCDFGIDSS